MDSINASIEDTISAFKSSAKDVVEQRARLEKELDAFVMGAPEKTRPIIKLLLPLFTFLFVIFDRLAPYLLRAYLVISNVVNQAPPGALTVLAGLVLCFFGGTFCVTIAAYEAFMLCGFDTTKHAFLELYEQFTIVKKAFQEEAKKSEQNKGKGEFSNLSPSEQVIAKSKIFLVSCKDPEKLSEALGGIICGFAGVLATLKSQFARVITLGASIGNTAYGTANKYCRPALEKAMPEAYHKWITVILSYTCKAIAVTLAWAMQKVISAVQSALRGGNMVVDGGIQLLQHYKVLPEKYDRDSTWNDEIVCYGLFFFGFYSQMHSMFTLHFPFSVLLFPFTMFENWLIWTVSNSPAHV